MSEVVGMLALLIVMGGVVAGVGVALRAGLRDGVPVLLDFLLAAGLLRLSTEAGWGTIGIAALVVAIRHVVTLGLRAGPPDDLMGEVRPAARGGRVSG